MINFKQRDSARAALTKAIESKVERMDMRGLVELASALNVPIPHSAGALRERLRERKHVYPRPPSVGSFKPAGDLLQGGGIGDIVSTKEGERLLDEITVEDMSADWVQSDLVGAGELVKRLRIARATLDNWRKAGKIIALRKGLRNFLYPIRQFDFERLGPVDGLEVIAPLFSSPEETWEWLVAPNRMTDGQPPIEKLRDGDVRVVERAAMGAFDFA